MDPAQTQRRELLLLILAGLFIGFFVCANLIGAKLFAFTLLGVGPDDLGLGAATSFTATSGLIAFPLTFILTDVINEYFGLRTVRRLTFIAVGVSVLLQVVVQAAIAVPTVQFDALPAALAPMAAAAGDDAAARNAVAHAGFALAFGSSWAIVAGSMAAFLIGQLIDVQVFARLRRVTGSRHVWLRAQGSTVVSQLIDTFVVIFLAFVLIPLATGGTPWPAFSSLGAFSAFSVSVTNYVYKFAIAVVITPLLYAAHAAVDAWLGRDLAHRLADEAHAR
jgi:uncharacterized PurR-regulated membrane protein YhhQ (DUF165 family)